VIRVLSVLVVGIGNRLREDDAFGPIVVEALEKRFDDARINIIECAGLTPELAEDLARAEHIIFIDASAELPPGVLEHRELSRDGNPDLSLVHFLSPEALLEWTSRLYNRAPRAEIWLMGTAATGLSEQLTPVVAAKVQGVVDLLRGRIRELLNPAEFGS
jgi:hydrogenase maturation protease